MIDRQYMLHKPSRPSAPKLFLDTQIVPLAANIAGGLEVAIDRSARRMGVRPATILIGVFALASLTLVYGARRRQIR